MVSWVETLTFTILIEVARPDVLGANVGGAGCVSERLEMFIGPDCPWS